jgi:DnaJ family protein B protein 4
MSEELNDYYSILGVEKNATEQEIKKAYRSLSLKYHPDRNPSEEARHKYLKINESYEILSDPAKRSSYDNRFNIDDMAGFPRDVGDILNMFFQRGNPFVGDFHVEGVNLPNFIHVIHQRQIHKPPPIVKSVEISLEQAFTGYNLPVEITKHNIINGIQIEETETIVIPVPEGVDDGEFIVLRNCGSTIENRITGDIKIIINIKNTTPFVRRGMDLWYNSKVSLKDALCGFTLEISHINGDTLTIKSQVVVSHGVQRCFHGRGMKKGNEMGNLILEFSVEFPKILTAEQNEILEGVLS